jgi:hypothetical protein
MGRFGWIQIDPHFVTIEVGQDNFSSSRGDVLVPGEDKVSDVTESLSVLEARQLTAQSVKASSRLDERPVQPTRQLWRHERTGGFLVLSAAGKRRGAFVEGREQAFHRAVPGSREWERVGLRAAECIQDHRLTRVRWDQPSPPLTRFHRVGRLRGCFEQGVRVER